MKPWIIYLEKIAVENKKYNIEELIKRYPALEVCRDDIEKAFELLRECFKSGHKLIIAGNGGSASDADHIVGELMKSFKNSRALDKDLANKLESLDPVNGKMLVEHLQQGLPAIALQNNAGLNTAFINDVANGGELIYAQQLTAYGSEGDVFLGISTSGNSKTIYNACLVAKAKGLKIIGLTGGDGGRLASISDVAIKAPVKETFMVQEYHLPIYHCLCLMLEDYFFQD